MNLYNKSILITGASGGIGKVIVDNLTRNKCSFFLHYHSNQSQVQEVVERPHFPITAIQADLSNREGVKKCLLP